MDKCIFCKIVKGEAKSWKVFENEHVYVFLDIHPMNKYHTLVIPKKHYVNIFDIPDDELREVISAVRKVVKLYEEKIGIKNVQIINSSGSEAQQDVFHLHFHIAPRHSEDGQDVQWKTYPEMTKLYDGMLEELR